MKINDILQEGLSRILYHYTGYTSAIEILKSGKFLLTSALGTEADRSINNNKIFYLSTTRTIVGRYHTNSPYGVLFQLNGQCYNSKVSGIPVDYWGDRKPEYSKNGSNQSEAEDRIVSNHNELPIGKGIECIHIFFDLNQKTPNTEIYKARIQQIATLANERNIPLKIYTNKKDIKFLKNPLNDITELFPSNNNSDERQANGNTFHYNRIPSLLDNIFSLIVKKSADELTDDEKKLLRRIDTYGVDDFVRVLSADMHNSKSPVSHNYVSNVRLSKELKKLNIHSLSDFKKYIPTIMNKWKKIFNR